MECFQFYTVLLKRDNYASCLKSVFYLTNLLKSIKKNSSMTFLLNQSRTPTGFIEKNASCNTNYINSSAFVCDYFL